MIVGGYFHVEAEGLTRERFLAQAAEVDADIEGIEVSRGGLTVNGRRGRVELYVSLQSPTNAVVQATPTGPSILLYSLGAAAVATAAAEVHRQNRTAPPPAGAADS